MTDAGPPNSERFRRQLKDETSMDDLERELTDLFAAPTPDRLQRRIQHMASSLEAAPLPAAADPTRPSGISSLKDHPHHRRFRPVGWISGIAAALVVVLLASGVALATGVVNPDRLFEWGFGTHHIAEKDQGVDLNMSQTVDGFTVTLGRAYADPFQIVLAVSIRQPEQLPNGTVGAAKDVLYDDHGRFLGGLTPSSGVESTDVGATTLLQYYTNPFDGHPASLTYRYEVDQIRWSRSGPDQTALSPQVLPAGMTCEPVYNRQQRGTPSGDQCNSYILNLQKPMSFTFTVPLAAGVNVVPGPQTASSGAVAQINQIAGGESGTRIDVSGVGPLATVTIEAGGKNYPLTTMGIACPYDATTRFGYVTETAIPTDAGPWTVQIDLPPTDQQLANQLAEVTNGCHPLDFGGSWQFSVDPTQ